MKNEQAAKVKDQEKTFSREMLIEKFMQDVLENDRSPRSIYKFSKEAGISESQFYNFFGSFEGLKQEIWNEFFANAKQVLVASPEFETFSPREKLLSFYYTFFEVLTANRSYILFTLAENKEYLRNLDQLKGLRRHVKEFARELVREGNEDKTNKIFKQSETVFSEATWIQLLFLMKFWLDDNSAKFESTDVAIEKSVNTVFDLFDNTPLERVLDLGKFLWKEKVK